MGYRIGELAAASDLTVRALHHYEEIGLLVASERSEAGHRRYTAGDVERLYRIRLLRRLGLSLHEIRRALDEPGWSLGDALSKHLADVEARMDAVARLRARLLRLQGTELGHCGPITDDLLEVLEEMTMLETSVQKTITYLVYEDLEGAFDYLQRVFRLGPWQLERDEAGEAVHGELDAGSAAIWLHRQSDSFDLASPRRLGGSTAGVAVMVDDVDDHHRHAVEHEAEIDYAPVDQPYGYREYSARDPEGGLWSFMQPLD